MDSAIPNSIGPSWLMPDLVKAQYNSLLSCTALHNAYSVTQQFLKQMNLLVMFADCTQPLFLFFFIFDFIIHHVLFNLIMDDQVLTIFMACGWAVLQPVTTF